MVEKFVWCNMMYSVFIFSLFCLFCFRYYGNNDQVRDQFMITVILGLLANLQNKK